MVPELSGGQQYLQPKVIMVNMRAVLLIPSLNMPTFTYLFLVQKVASSYDKSHKTNCFGEQPEITNRLFCLFVFVLFCFFLIWTLHAWFDAIYHACKPRSNNIMSASQDSKQMEINAHIKSLCYKNFLVFRALICLFLLCCCSCSCCFLERFLFLFLHSISLWAITLDIYFFAWALYNVGQTNQRNG